MFYNMAPYAGYRVEDVVVDGVSVGPLNKYRFTDVRENHTIHVTFIMQDLPSDSAPKNMESVRKLIDHLINGTPLTYDYDFNKDGIVDGRDLILLEAFAA